MLISLISIAHAADDGISTHLMETLGDLRNAEITGLSVEQQTNRAAALQVLAVYIDRGVYPHNHIDPQGRTRPVHRTDAFDLGPGVTPVFIDEHGTPCAVGALMLGTGHGDLARRIAQQNNQVFIDELTLDTGVTTWATQMGLSQGELARIQPGYGFMKTPPYQWPVTARPMEQQTINLTAGTGPAFRFLVEQNFHDLGMCAQHLTDQTQAFEVSVDLTVADGNVTNAKLVSNGTGVEAYGACAVKAFDGLTSPGPLAGTARWTWVVRHKTAPVEPGSKKAKPAEKADGDKPQSGT